MFVRLSNNTNLTSSILISFVIYAIDEPPENPSNSGCMKILCGRFSDLVIYLSTAFNLAEMMSSFVGLCFFGDKLIEF